jgi:hypothetical protein
MKQKETFMSKTIWAIFASFTLILAACSKSASPTYTPPVLEETWAVKMTVSGGIAGILRTIDVNSTGSYSVADQRSGKIATGNLTEAELATLQALISSLEVSTPKNPSACADCFEYELEIESGGKKMIASADDLSLGESGMGELVQFLRQTMDAALQ